MTGVRGWRAALVAVVVAVSLPAARPADAAGATTVKAANVVSFTYSAASPQSNVVGSSTTYTRTPGQSLVLTISVVPMGKVAVFQATLRNAGTAPVVFGSGGVRVDGRVTGGSPASWRLKAPSLVALAPGQSRSMAGTFPLARSGSYTVEAAARY